MSNHDAKRKRLWNEFKESVLSGVADEALDYVIALVVLLGVATLVWLRVH